MRGRRVRRCQALSSEVFRGDVRSPQRARGGTRVGRNDSWALGRRAWRGGCGGTGSSRRSPRFREASSRSHSAQFNKIESKKECTLCSLVSDRAVISTPPTRRGPGSDRRTFHRDERPTTGDGRGRRRTLRAPTGRCRRGRCVGAVAAPGGRARIAHDGCARRRARRPRASGRGLRTSLCTRHYT